MPAFLTAAAVLLVVPGTAAAAERYTTPTATVVSGACPIELPCRIDRAVNNAEGDDVVNVAPGTYEVERELDLEGADMRGLAGEPAPELVGDQSLDDALLTFEGAGTLSHLTLRSTAPGETALKLTGATGEDLTVISEGDAVKLIGGSSGVSLLRDSVARSASGDAVRMADGGPDVPPNPLPVPGDVALRNVTALSIRDHAVHCRLRDGRGSLVNVIARGRADVIADPGTRCEASHSNLREDPGTNLVLGAGIQSGDPLYTTGGFWPLPLSPTVDAGVGDSLVSAQDPDGRPRTVPDIGPFECCTTDDPPVTLITPDPGTLPDAPAIMPVPALPDAPAITPDPGVLADAPEQSLVAPPELGSSVVVSGTGRVLVRVPGGQFRLLDGPTQLPVGTVVDAKAGRITLVTALDNAGHTQSGGFWGGRFQIRQGRNGRGMTTLALRGGNFRSCRRGGKLASAAAKKKPVRSLWSRDKGGRFRTHGHNSVATARGTSWVMQDRCNGTLTRVFEGAVSVRDRTARRTVLVRAGHKYLARR